MKIDVVGKNGFVPSDANRDYVEKRLGKIENYFKDQNELEVRVVCKAYPEYKKVEVTIPTKNVTLRAEAQDETLYGAIDRSLDKLVGQVRKYKTRVKTKNDKLGLNEVFSDQMFDAKQLEKEVLASELVKNKEVTLEPLTVDEAMEQLELTGHDFFIYLDKMTHKVNVIYIRDDGNYAVIETK
jgi:putative sigma-54 modulation protein